MKKSIVQYVGKLEWKSQRWAEDPESQYMLNGYSLRYQLDLDNFDGKKVKITIEEVVEDDETEQ